MRKEIYTDPTNPLPYGSYTNRCVTFPLLSVTAIVEACSSPIIHLIDAAVVPVPSTQAMEFVGLQARDVPSQKSAACVVFRNLIIARSQERRLRAVDRLRSSPPHGIVFVRARRAGGAGRGGELHPVFQIVRIGPRAVAGEVAADVASEAEVRRSAGVDRFGDLFVLIDRVGGFAGERRRGIGRRHVGNFKERRLRINLL